MATAVAVRVEEVRAVEVEVMVAAVEMALEMGVGAWVVSEEVKVVVATVVV